MDHIKSVPDLYKSNFLEYASYVIRDRALPDIRDGLKPVQRRILHSLYEKDDGRFHKVANIIGHTMQYHPHGDASIGESLVVLTNKNYFIEPQGNFGNILTGDVASAPRYIECRLTSLAKEVLFNPEITKFVDSYDGRHKEPAFMPCKIPYILLHGAEGIAVGMATKILPHNFCEVLEAQIAFLKEESFNLYPDFEHGGIIDVSEYNDGLGKVKIRAKIEKTNNKTLVIKEIPFGTTTERIIASIEDAIRKNKIKLSSITDFTAEHIEIECSTQRGVSADDVLDRLYAYTECEVAITPNMNLIINNMPKTLTVTEIIKHSTEQLLEFLKEELRILINKLKEKLHYKTLEQIFIENKIYLLIEECETYEKAKEVVFKKIQKYIAQFEREVTDDDIEKLLEIPIKRIAKFDLDKNKNDIKEINERIKTEQNNLHHIKKYTINFINSLLKKYGKLYPRKTKISSFEVIHARDIQDTDTKVYYDKATGYIGTKVKGDSKLECSEFSKILLITQKGIIKVITIPEKLFCDKLVYFGIADKELVFNSISRDKKSGFSYVKRFKVEKYIQNKEYSYLDPNHRLENFTSKDNIKIEVEYERNVQDKPIKETFDISEFPVRQPNNRGTKLGTRKTKKAAFIFPKLVNIESN